MKTRQHAARVAAFLAVCTVAGTANAGPSTSPAIPVGSLSANPTVVKAGTNPLLSWNITYPSTVSDYVADTGSCEVTCSQQLNYKIRVLGAGVTAVNASGTSVTFVPTEAQLSAGGSSYQRIFFGTNEQVKPNTVVWSGTAVAGETLRFGGRYYYNDEWDGCYNSDNGSSNVRTLVNGQVPPTTYPLHLAPTLESFLKPYLDGSGRVSIGPMDVIVFMELTHTAAEANELGYDLQDMVLLVTFEQPKSNNGHGNNADGVDSSNPGAAPFIDSDPTVDDESKGGGRNRK